MQDLPIQQVVKQEEAEQDAYERMDTSGLEVLGLPTQFGGQRSRKVCALQTATSTLLLMHNPSQIA